MITKNYNVKWSLVSKRKKRCPLISDSLKVKIQDWIIKHPFVFTSLISNDIILVRDRQISKKANRIGNYLI